MTKFRRELEHLARAVVFPIAVGQKRRWRASGGLDGFANGGSVCASCVMTVSVLQKWMLRPCQPIFARQSGWDPKSNEMCNEIGEKRVAKDLNARSDVQFLHPTRDQNA